MKCRAKSPTPGLRPAFASTASRRSVARGLGPKSPAKSTAPQTFEEVATEVLERLEIIIGFFRARIAAYDASRSATLADLAPLPSLTSAFATRRAVFGPVELDEQGGLV